MKATAALLLALNLLAAASAVTYTYYTDGLLQNSNTKQISGHAESFRDASRPMHSIRHG